jgi:hypothetical protein
MVIDLLESRPSPLTYTYEPSGLWDRFGQLACERKFNGVLRSARRTSSGVVHYYNILTEGTFDISGPFVEDKHEQ